MLLYLVRHGEAKSEEEDKRRPLTERGVRHVAKSARFVFRQGGSLCRAIFHSGKLRAFQTANILANALRLGDDVCKIDCLNPLDDPNILAQRLNRISYDLIVVGHLPHLAKVASILLSGEEDKVRLEFTDGAVASLKRDENGLWTLLSLTTTGIW
ncbi:phosphohistidine phosphatase, SixA [Candidatus Magnetoovum chiemensis]|nr:phosphohistidine phosphatase, SixA [Candidatus Magnetoovum chiemensis]